MRSLVNLRNICRMCGERYDEDSKSVDIFEPCADGSTYAELMSVHLDLQPQSDDGKPRRIGQTCAKLLEEWTEFKKKILETQKELLKIQQRRVILEIQLKQIDKAENILKNLASVDSSESDEDVAADNKPSTSRMSQRLAEKRRAEVGESSGCSSSSNSKKQKKSSQATNSKVKKGTSSAKKRKR